MALVRTVRWLLASSSSLAAERLAAIDALDLLLADHQEKQHERHL